MACSNWLLDHRLSSVSLPLHVHTLFYINEPSKQIPRIAGIVSLAFLALIGFAFSLKISEEFSRVWAFSWFGSMLFLIVLCRYALAAFVRGWYASGEEGIEDYLISLGHDMPQMRCRNQRRASVSAGDISGAGTKG